MISRITGHLERVAPDRVTLRSGPMSLDVLVPAADAERLEDRLGGDITLHTLMIIDSQNQGTSFMPRLLGFATADDRAFFELFITCKGIGHRKALRAMALPASAIANAITHRDLPTLQRLPEIGKRTAETIIATLSGKVDRFTLPDPDRPAVPTKPLASPSGLSGPAEEAAGILIRLGEQRATAEVLIDRALKAEPDADSPDAILAAVYRLR
ncbi:MAG: Holliday junction branch migration protein RuvA [Phycisphaeraceae bacterium]